MIIGTQRLLEGMMGKSQGALIASKRAKDGGGGSDEKQDKDNMLMTIIFPCVIAQATSITYFVIIPLFCNHPADLTSWM